MLQLSSLYCTVVWFWDRDLLPLTRKYIRVLGNFVMGGKEAGRMPRRGVNTEGCSFPGLHMAHKGPWPRCQKTGSSEGLPRGRQAAALAP